MALVRPLRVEIKEHVEGSDPIVSDILANYISKSGFPTAYQESMKGEGYFDFQVRSFHFEVIWDRFRNDMIEQGKTFSVEPKRLSTIDFYLQQDGGNWTHILNGFIDEVQLKIEEDETIYELTVFPSALLLKDVDVGEEKEDDEGESFYLYETKSDSGRIIPKSIKEIVDEVLPEVNSRIEGASFQTSDESIPDAQPPSKDKLIGNKLHQESKWGFLYAFYLWVFEGVTTEENHPDDAKNLIYREDTTADGTGDWFMSKSIRFAFKEIVPAGWWINLPKGTWLDWESGEWFQVNAGQWANWSFSLPTSISFSWRSGISIGWTTIAVNVPPVTLSFPPAWHIPPFDLVVPPVGIYIPTIAKTKKVYKLQGGGMEFWESKTWYPLWPFSDSEQHFSYIGSPYTNDDMTVTPTKRDSILESLGYLREHDATVDEVVSFDHDESDYYVLCRIYGTSEKTKVRPTQVLISLESPFDDSYKVQIKNWKFMKLLQNLAKVSNRYVFIDVDNNVNLIPRSTDLDDGNNDLGQGTVALGRDNLLKWKKKFHREDEVDLEITRLKRNEDGGIDEYGFHLRTPEYEGIKKYYTDYFSRQRDEYTIDITATPAELDDVKLLKKLTLDGVDYGNIIAIDRNFLENKVKIITEIYHPDDET